MAFKNLQPAVTETDLEKTRETQTQVSNYFEHFGCFPSKCLEYYIIYSSTRYIVTDFSIAKRRKIVRINPLTTSVTSALDRTQTSDRFAAHIVKKTVEAAASALELDSDDVKVKFTASKTSVARLRTQNRKETVAEVRSDFDNNKGPFVVHWDGKLFREGKDIFQLQLILSVFASSFSHFSFL